MKVVSERFGFGRDSTLSALWIDTTLVGFVIEDERRKAKVYGETCIPAGTYSLALRHHGGFHERYGQRFGTMHKGMIELVGVPGFSDVLIHCGNTDDDTNGCLLVNATPLIGADGEFVGAGSEAMYKLVYPQIAESIIFGAASITIREREAA